MDNNRIGQGNPSGGSASDHLANERTFLAWVRTGIGIMAFGFVVVKFTLFVKQISLVIQHPLAVPGHGYSEAIGVFLVAFGVLLSLLAFLRYRITTKQLTDAVYKPSALLTGLLMISVVLAGVLLVVYLLNNVRN
jgi:putative membrane protein